MSGLHLWELAPPTETAKTPEREADSSRVGVIYTVGRPTRVAVSFFHINHIVREHGMRCAYEV